MGSCKMSAPLLTQTLLVLIALQLYCAATLPQHGIEHELPVPDLYYHAWPQVGVDGGPQPQVLRNGKPRNSVNGAVKRNTGPPSQARTKSGDSLGTHRRQSSGSLNTSGVNIINLPAPGV